MLDNSLKQGMTAQTQNEMDEKFQKHTTTYDGSGEEGEAVISDFSKTEFGHNYNMDYSIYLYLTLPNGKVGRVQVFYNKEDNLLDSLINRPFIISDTLGKKVSVERNNESELVLKNHDYSVELVENTPEWELDARRNLEESVREISEPDYNTEPDSKFDTATISNVTVKDSDPNIVQELEIKLEFILPNGQTEKFHCIHDEEHPEEWLGKFLSIAA